MSFFYFGYKFKIIFGGGLGVRGWRGGGGRVGGWGFWLVGCLGLNGPLRQYFSLYRAREREKGKRNDRRE